jgi:DNA mismatch repair protein MutL
MEVERLFARHPARRKFLATARSERAAIARVCSEAALAHPEIALSLEIGERRLLASPGRSGGKPDREAELRGAFAAVWGADVADEAIWFADETPIEGSAAGRVELWGLAATPSRHRGRRNGVQLFVNGRPVQSSRLGYAVEQAYAELLPSRRYPTVALFLRLPGDRVDVNVHPSKAIVKLRDEAALFGVIQERIRAALLDGIGVRPYAGAVRTGDGATAGLGDEPPASAPVDGERRAAQTLAGAGQRPADGSEQTLGIADATSPNGASSLMGLPVLRLLGQLRTTFIVAEGPQGMVLIDQHAAHERVTYERLLATRDDADDATAQQALLYPPLIELSVAQSAALASHVEALAAFGFSLEPFGERTLRLRALPACFGERDARASLTAVLDDLAGETHRGERNDPVAASTACHASVRAGQTLQREEMGALLRDLEQCDNPHSCPHGRPTLIEFATPDLLRQFGRT